jgi:hypothetical protein
MTYRRVWQVLAGIALTLVVSKPASAAPISVGEVDWYGAIFTVDLVSSANNWYSFEYTADFTTFDSAAAGDHTDYIVGINFKPSQGNLVSYTSATTDAAGSWTYGVDSNLSSAGFTASCAPKGTGNDFFCGALTDGKDYTANPTTGTPPPIYTWDFSLRITGVTNPELLALNAPLRALFTSGTTNRQGDYYTALMSETTGGGTPVPEPATQLLVALGLPAILRNRQLPVRE